MYIFDKAKIQKFKKHFKTCLESSNVKHNILLQRFSLTFAEEFENVFLKMSLRCIEY